MGLFHITLGRNSSACLFAAFAGFGALGCSDTSDPGNSSGGGSTGQSGNTGNPQAGNASGGSGQGGGAGSAAAGTPGMAAGNGGMSSAGSAGASGSGGNGGSGGGVDPNTLEKFSFFVTSMKAMIELGGEKGFGGDLRFGEADGLKGADKICTTIAEKSMPGSSSKEWHAFLSTVAGPVHARTRIGTGPWYDRTGRLVGMSLDDLIDNLDMGRPSLADAAIKNDLPNEDGIPNKKPDPNAPEDDTHHFLTGSDAKGNLYTAEPRATCSDWTTTNMNNATTGDGVGRPRIGFSFIAGNRNHWISGQTEGGCGAGITGVGMVNGGSDPKNPIVGSGGGYGGIYCFAMKP